MLQALARALSSLTRRPSDLAARVGSEEFAILLPDTGDKGAANVAERVHEAVEGLMVKADGENVGRITVSVELAFGLAGEDGTPSDLFDLTNAALYAGNAMGRTAPAYNVMPADGSSAA
ncbi:diguanylate cyclase domain-containing protein [Methylobacterium aquaticum]|uniref:diguanylate cyclase domain-containing protein n=1 Tax=Methylobacterium aquaticum TaxID=270351 RepID=UPI003D17A9CB